MTKRSTRRCTIQPGLCMGLLFTQLLLSANHTYAQGMNLARYMPTSASSEPIEYPARLATDGMVSPISRWVSEVGPHWLEVELPERFEIGSANVFTGNYGKDAAVNFSLEYWTGEKWTVIPGAEIKNNTKTQLRILFDKPVSTDRIRFASDDKGVVNVAELAVFPPNNSKGFPIDETMKLEVGLVPFVTASSQLPGDHRPFLATDGLVDPASQWISESGEGPHWLQVRFQSDRSIGYAHIYTDKQDNALSDFHLEYLVNDQWETVPGTDTSDNKYDTVLIAFDPIMTQGIRLVIDDDNSAIVRELVLLPPNNGDGYPVGTEVTIAPPTKTQFSTYGDDLYLLTQTSSGNVIGVVDDQLTLGTFKGGENQQYHLLNLYGTDYYRIVNRGTNKCLEVIHASTGSDAAVHEGDYHALDYQLWTVKDAKDGLKQLINVHSGLALAVDASGKTLVQLPANNSSHAWDIVYHNHFPKKGLAEQGAGPHINSMRSQSVYNWGLRPAGDNPPGLHHQPMLWGNRFYERMALRQAEWYSTAEPVYLMGFNEPDHTDQSDITAQRALALWSAVEAIDLPLVSLCSSNWYNRWSLDWFEPAMANHYRFDLTAVHYYITGGPNAGQFMDTTKGAYDRFHKPIWLTEWNIVNWGGPARWTDEQVYTWMSEVLYRLESAEHIDRYFFFPFAVDWPNGKPGAPWEIDRLTLRPLGRLYGAWDADMKIHPEMWYYLHNKASHQRLNVSDGDAGMTTITDIHPDTNWYLVHAGSERYYIVSRDGDKRLGVKGSAPAMFAKDARGRSVEWVFTPHEHGWFFLENPASESRLQFNQRNKHLMLVSPAEPSADVQWRVIKPYLPGAKVGETDNMAPDAPFWLRAREAEGIVRLDWKSTGPESDFDHYEVHRSTTEGGPYELIADNIKAFTYSDSTVKKQMRYYYVVRSVDMAGNVSEFSNEEAAYPANWVRVSSRDKSITYTGQWRTDPRDRWLEYVSQTPGSKASLTFTGSGIRYYGFIRDTMGILEVSLDGKPVAEVDAYLGSQRKHMRLFEATDLADSEHTITVRLTGRKNPKAFDARGIIDVFEVLSDEPDKTPPAVPTNVAVHTDLDQIKVTWSGSSEIDLAGYTVLRAEENSDDFKPIAEKLTDTHYVDQGVKLGSHYSYAITSHDAAGNVSNHTEPIKTSPGKWIKIDDTHDNVKYEGTWGTYTQNPSYNYSEHYTETKGATAIFTFTGSQVRFFGYQRNDLGKADILLDGKVVHVADCFSDYTGYDTLVYESDELPHGQHTLTVRVRGDKNDRSSGTEFIIDAFEFKTTKR